MEPLSIPRSSLSSTGNFLLSLIVVATLKKYSNELRDITSTAIGRPARLYRAYKEYSLAYNIEQLESLLVSSPASEHPAITVLLEQYTLAKNILTIKTTLYENSNQH